MFSIKGIFKDNTIHLLEPLKLKEKTNVIVTFIDESSTSAVSPASDDTIEEADELLETEDTFEDLPDDFDDMEEDIEDLSEEIEDLDDGTIAGDDELSEEYYSKIRKHKRYIANGNISLIEGEEEVIYPLFDYSAGGLSFISDKPFDVGVSLTASIKDPIEQDMSVLDFEFEVARSVEYNGKYKIGCKFFDEVDEEIWHSLMS